MNIENPKETIQYPDIARELQEMVDVDQEMRNKVDLEPNSWDNKVDQKNTARMKEIIAKIGFPTVSKVGKDGARNAWLLVQHADLDVEFQKMCLGLMKEAPLGEVEKIDIAYLEDRVRVGQMRGQLYGTQFNQKDGKHVPQPIEDEGRVNERRKEMGMDTLQDQIDLMYKKYPFVGDK